MNARRRAGALLLGVLLSVSACKHGYNETDFNIAMAKHHSNLRWGRVENAALVVDPALRLAFVTEWTRRQGQIELQEVEVAGVVMAEDGNTADVVLRISYVERDTMSVRQVMVPEKWERTADGWLAKVPASLETQQPAPDAPPETAPLETAPPYGDAPAPEAG